MTERLNDPLPMMPRLTLAQYAALGRIDVTSAPPTPAEVRRAAAIEEMGSKLCAEAARTKPEKPRLPASLNSEQ